MRDLAPAVFSAKPRAADGIMARWPAAVTGWRAMMARPAEQAR
jgi:hypothetical protein